MFTVTVFISQIIFLCGCSRGSQDPAERLTAYCIRQCVLETSDSEVCDTKCKCAVETLAGDVPGREFAELVNEIIKNGPHAEDYIHKFKIAFVSCPGLK